MASVYSSNHHCSGKIIRKQSARYELSGTIKYRSSIHTETPISSDGLTPPPSSPNHARREITLSPDARSYTSINKSPCPGPLPPNPGISAGRGLSGLVKLKTAIHLLFGDTSAPCEPHESPVLPYR